jgi:hypothetical protein
MTFLTDKSSPIEIVNLAQLVVPFNADDLYEKCIQLEECEDHYLEKFSWFLVQIVM